MATRTPTASFPSKYQSNGEINQWTGLLNGDDGAGVDLARFSIGTLQVTGTFGAGGSVALEGTNDGTNWFALNSSAGTPVAITAAGGVALQTLACRLVRPRVTAGDGTTSLVATLYAHAR